MLPGVVKICEDESGATAIEYVLIAAFLSVLIISGATLLGKNLSAKYSSIATQVAAAGR